MMPQDSRSKPSNRTSQHKINVVLNWSEELKRLVPTGE